MIPAFYGVIAAIGWGSSDVIGRITARELGPVGAMWGLSVTGAIVASAMFGWFAPHMPHGAMAWGFLLGTSVAAVFAPILFYKGLTLGPMALVAPLAAAYPVWVLPVALLQGFRPVPLAWLAMALVGIGAVVVGHTAPEDPDVALAADPANRRKAIIVALLTSGAFAVTLVAGGHSAGLVGSVTTLWSTRVVGAVLIAAVLPWRGVPGFRSPRIWALLLFQALLDNTAFAALYEGSQDGGTAITAVASSAFMVVAVILAAVFLKERMGLRCAAGALAVFAGIACLAAVGP